MQVVVIKMRNDGVAIRKSSLAEQAEHRGYLVLNDTQQNHLYRMVKTARLFRDAECQQQMELLLESNVIWINDERLMISGFERSKRADVEVDFAQSWLCLLGDQTLKVDKWAVDYGPISRKRR